MENGGRWKKEGRRERQGREEGGRRREEEGEGGKRRKEGGVKEDGKEVEK